MKENKLRLAVRTALAVGGLATAAVSPTAFAQDEDSAELGRVEVTGSRIKRTDVEGALPVQIIDRETIELSGEVSVADVLRNLPINSGGSFRPQSGSTGQAAATLNLRALGAGRTLILIDGRRAPVAPNLGVGQDLNQIPIGAVERIEILSDGASAIYGTDAIGGVVNIITRKDFEGAQIAYGEGYSSREGGDTAIGSLLFGASGAKSSIIAGVSYNKREIVFQRDRPWSRGGASTFSNNFLGSGVDANGDPIRDLPDISGALDADDNPIPDGIPDARPLRFLGATDTDEDGTIDIDNGILGPGNVPGCQGPSFSVSASGFCFYDFTSQAADEAELENLSFFARSTYEIDEDWTLFGNFSVNRVESFGRYAPVPSSPWLVGGFGAIVLPVGSPNHPSTAPTDGGLNPAWADYGAVANETLLLRHRFAANGPRDTSTDSTQYDLDVGVRGLIGEVDVEFGARWTDSGYVETGRNYIVSALAQPQFDSGAYNIYDPFGVSEDVRNSFTATIGRDSFTEQVELYAIGSTDLLEMEHGPLSVAFGAEYRDENFADEFDALQANGNITGSAGNSSAYRRHQYAVFAEVLVPILEDLEVTAAGRFDDYSDFGDVFVPKIAARWQPLDELTLRASWGEGFRAPPVGVLAAAPSFSADTVVDQATCVSFGQAPDCQLQVTGFVIANPNLGPEESDQFSFGVAFQPFDWFSGSVDYFQTEITERIANIGPQTVVNCVAGTQVNCPPGLTELSPTATPGDPTLGLGVARGADGAILFLQRGQASLGTIDVSGVDVSLNTTFDLGGFGTLTNELVASQVLSYEIDGGDDIAGEAELPDFRAILRTVWNYGDFNVAYNINHIGPQDSALSPSLDRLSSWTTHDIQVTYLTPYNVRLSAGVDNIGDKDPVLDPGEGRGFNLDLYDQYGRVTYVRAQVDF
ncbi:MAG: TonB-dependent receptor [Pseudomonadota bacterium]